MVPLRYNIRSLFVRRLTTFATALGIGLVVFVFAGALMLDEGINRAVHSAARPDNAIVLRKGSENELSSGFPATDLALLSSSPQVASGTGMVIGEIVTVMTAERADGSGGISNLTIRGMPEAGFKFREEAKLVSGTWPRPGTNEVVIGSAVNGRFLDPGTSKVIEPGGSFDLKRNRPLQVVGVFSAKDSTFEAEVWGDLDVIRKHLNREATLSSARVRLKSPDDFDAYRDTLERDPRLSVKVQREADYLASQSEDIAQFLSILGISIAFLFSIAAMIGAAITMNAAVANRSREIGTLRALGFGKISILISFLFEAIVLAALGGILGSIFVLILTTISFPVMNFQTFSEIVISFAATPSVFVSALIFSSALGLIGGLVPAIRAARISPVEAMRA
jgi:putative ABC transport system permease protein